MTDLFVSFSGGLTSAYMTRRIFLDETITSKYDKIHVVFANTGQEHEETLAFVNRFSDEFKIPVVWVEASVVHNKRQGSKFSIVNHNSASRNGEPFEQVIKKYGIPNISYPHCKRELKINPMHDYLKHIVGSKDYDTAIGIRADEADRVASDFKKRRLIYPLIGWNIKRHDVDRFWRNQKFTLNLDPHMGNCVTCFEKSFYKLGKIISENPSAFDFNRRMEKLYSDTKGDRRYFFRGHNSTKTLFEMKINKDPKMNERVSGRCGNTCEMFADE